MIPLEIVKRAVELVNSDWYGFTWNSVGNQIVMTLRLYKEREEFDGSLESAIECLKLTQYEVEEK